MGNTINKSNCADIIERKLKRFDYSSKKREEYFKLTWNGVFVTFKSNGFFSDEKALNKDLSIVLSTFFAIYIYFSQYKLDKTSDFTIFSKLLGLEKEFIENNITRQSTSTLYDGKTIIKNLIKQNENFKECFIDYALSIYAKEKITSKELALISNII